jgi:hypothetical protein
MIYLIGKIDLPGNTQMMIGVGLVIAALFGQKIFSSINFSGIKSGLSKLNPFSGSTSSSTSTTNVHGLVASLMDYFTTRTDSQGLSLAVAVGQHIYQQQADEMSKKIKHDSPVATPKPMDTSSSSQEKP